jgi:tetratricopeptide (TPR) repeat protein
VDLGPPLGHDDAPPPEPEDPWGDSRTEAFPPNVFEDEDRGNQMNDASAVVDIEIAAEMEEALAARAPEPRCASAFDNTSMSARDRLLGLVAESELLVAAGDLESAKRVLSKAQGLAPEDDDVRKKLLSVNEAIDAAQAYAFLERAMRGGPQAVELARRATQLRPARDVLLRSLAVFVRGGAHDEVADVAEQLLELDPDDEGALRTLLDANVAMQRWELAVSAGESLLRLRPDDEQLREKLAGVKARARRR